MSSHQTADSAARPQRTCETLEERLALSAQALDLAPDWNPLSVITDSLVPQSLNGGGTPEQQVDYVRDQYAFTGAGQTVAIIDSGIAWDHYALGGGFGEDFRVVGGWDFVENDANPFDDGPAGFHGTHVAGIVGSDDAVHQGVAPEVDLVGLRVFDDRGNGKLEWVEQALQWVHANRHAFENPITTVNLSLGFNWNSDTVPNWSTLEDEFAQLRRDGIFISVAAGNSFQDYLTTGLSYPAASPAVVPVASHGSDGLLSDFSQRNDRVIVAPGENVTSTIPAHLYGQTGPSNKFLATSGTSMAAPFLAGSSTLLRQAFDIAGENDIDQDLIYQHFRETADQIYDTVTRSWYSRLNLRAAIDAALEDGHGDSTSAATHLGKASSLNSFEGILARHGDVDYFRFQADQSGKITMQLDASHDLDLQFSVIGQSVQRQGDQITFQVTQGEEYFIRLDAAAGQGNYRIDSTFESTFPAVRDLGIVRSETFRSLSSQGESSYQVTASRSGILTVEARLPAGAGVSLEVLDARGQRIAIGSASESGTRVDIVARQGEQYVVKITGGGDSFDLKFTNLVRTTGDRVIVGGTGQDDNYVYESRPLDHHLEVNGTTYQFSKSLHGKVRIHGGTGRDTIHVTGSRQAETASGGEGTLVFYGSQTDVISSNFESTTIVGNGGHDIAVIHDSSAADLFRGTSDRATLTGGGFHLELANFIRVTALSDQGGDDRAVLVGSGARDLLHIHQQGTSLSGEAFQNYVVGFERVTAVGGGGLDDVMIRGTARQEFFRLDPARMSFENVQGITEFEGFSDVTVQSGGGADRALLAGLENSDALEFSDRQVRGLIRGNAVLLDRFHSVDWTPAENAHPEVSVAAVDQIFDLLAGP